LDKTDSAERRFLRLGNAFSAIFYVGRERPDMVCLCLDDVTGTSADRSDEDFRATLNKSFLDVFSGRESEVTGLALAESIPRVIDDSALRASPFGPASPFCLRQSRAAHPCAAATLSFSALP
jgi:hypothetical protein